jgi:hypothetical protein
VESEIRRDLTTLARNNAISDALLVVRRKTWPRSSPMCKTSVSG